LQKQLHACDAVAHAACRCRHRTLGLLLVVLLLVY
jgi:hypothetical protein